MMVRMVMVVMMVEIVVRMGKTKTYLSWLWPFIASQCAGMRGTNVAVSIVAVRWHSCLCCSTPRLLFSFRLTIAHLAAKEPHLKGLVGFCPRRKPISTSDFLLPYIDLLTQREREKWMVAKKPEKTPTDDATKPPQGRATKYRRRNIHQIRLRRFFIQVLNFSNKITQNHLSSLDGTLLQTSFPSLLFSWPP